MILPLREVVHVDIVEQVVSDKIGEFKNGACEEVISDESGHSVPEAFRLGSPVGDVRISVHEGVFDQLRSAEIGHEGVERGLVLVSKT